MKKSPTYVGSQGRLRSRLALRTRLRDPVRVKQEAELRWWLETWDPVIRGGGFNPGDVPAFLDGEPVAPTYDGRRWQQARAEVRRVAHEAGLGDEHWFEGKVVVDIGPGPLGFPDACPAQTSIGIEPLAERFAEAGLLLADSRATYLAIGAERIPLLRASVDVVLARNSLDHVEDPEKVLREAARILRPDGILILIFDIDHTPTATEPHSLSVQRVRAGLDGLVITREQLGGQPFGTDGRRAIVTAQRAPVRGGSVSRSSRPSMPAG
jgi:SAM-dependent methyltransferase